MTRAKLLLIVNKTASVTTANVGDTFTYTITAKNGNKATAAWKNVVMNDTLPTGVKLVGGVYLNNEFALYNLSGNALSVLVGDLERVNRLKSLLTCRCLKVRLVQRLPTLLRLMAITVTALQRTRV